MYTQTNFTFPFIARFLDSVSQLCTAVAQLKAFREINFVAFGKIIRVKRPAHTHARMHLHTIQHKCQQKFKKATRNPQSMAKVCPDQKACARCANSERTTRSLTNPKKRIHARTATHTHMTQHQATEYERNLPLQPFYKVSSCVQYTV